jgi:galactosamine-6-phosphate isomerase
MMKLIVHDDYEAMSAAAAQWLVDRIRTRPAMLACLAAGSTPTRAYELFVEWSRRTPELFDELRLIALDEWGGLSAENPGSCQFQLRREVVAPLGMDERFLAFDGDAPNLQAECDRVADWLSRHGPIDACVLGLGINGHLGFNEPADALQPHAHVTPLAATSLGHAMVRDLAAKPAFGMTLGMADLLHAREVLLLVSGQQKGPALRALLHGPLTTAFPASLLHLHSSVTLICDGSAYAALAAGI